MNPSDWRCRCPTCGYDLWAERGGEYTLANRTFKFDPTAGGFTARCPECRGLVPVSFLAPLEESPTPIPGPPSTAGVRMRMVVRVDKPRGP